MSDTTRSPFIDEHPTAKLSDLVKKERAPVGKGLAPFLGPFLSRSPFRKTHFRTKHIGEGQDREKGRGLAPSPRLRIGGGEKGRGPAPSLRLRIGVSLAILIVLSLVGMAIRTSLAFQDVTAFQVGARKMVPLYIGGGGIIYPRQQIPVSYAAAGHITTVIVKVGDQVKAGQPLITLDQSQVNAQISLAANDVAAAQAYLNSVSNAIPYNPVTVANAQQRLQMAQNRYNALTSQSSNTLQDGNLVAPAAGIVSAINVTPGQNFAAQTVLLTLIDPSTVTVHTQIPLENFTQVRNGMSATVNPSALPDKSLTGTVTSILPQANPQTDTFEAYIEIANAQQELLPGMSAFVRIQSQTNAFVVPRLSVLNPDRESAVFKIRNNHAYITQVHVIGRSDNTIYIDQGLSPNDLIVLLPLNRMREGQHVNIIHQEHT
jgi:RND family efflux transporter MFP subunit